MLPNYDYPASYLFRLKSHFILYHCEQTDIYIDIPHSPSRERVIVLISR